MVLVHLVVVVGVGVEVGIVDELLLLAGVVIVSVGVAVLVEIWFSFSVLKGAFAIAVDIAKIYFASAPWMSGIDHNNGLGSRGPSPRSL